MEAARAELLARRAARQEALDAVGMLPPEANRVRAHAAFRVELRRSLQAEAGRVATQPVDEGTEEEWHPAESLEDRLLGLLQDIQARPRF